MIVESFLFTFHVFACFKISPFKFGKLVCCPNIWLLKKWVVYYIFKFDDNPTWTRMDSRCFLSCWLSSIKSLKFIFSMSLCMCIRAFYALVRVLLVPCVSVPLCTCESSSLCPCAHFLALCLYTNIFRDFLYMLVIKIFCMCKQFLKKVWMRLEIFLYVKDCDNSHTSLRIHRLPMTYNSNLCFSKLFFNYVRFMIFS